LGKARLLDGQIAFMEEGIDKRVYIPYGLTENEIKIVEGK